MSITNAQKGRRKRALALGRVATGSLPLREVLRDGYTALDSCPVWRVVLCAPGMGTQSVRNLFERSHVYPLLALKDLTKSERRALIDNLPRRVL